MTEEKFDAIVVGAGVAGSASALRMAQKGLQVVLIERGPFPGSKNLSGGVLYGRVLQELIPDYWEEAPVERCITNQVVSFMTAGASFNIDFKNQAFNQPPYNAFTVLRAKFDRWLAEKAEEAGAMLVPGIKVERVLKDSSGRVIGVSTGGEEILADVVVAADGATSFLAQEAGLRGRIPTRQVATGVKQVIALPREVIEERFRLTGDEGAAYTIVGYATRGVAGGGFLYTNRESLSVGLVMRLDDLVRTRSRSGEIMEDFLASPAIAPFIRGGRLLEYGAHLVPEGGVEMMPQLFTGGMLVVGDAAGLGINSGFVIRGMDLAIGSAIAAADTVIEAKARGDFSAQSLSAYQEKLEQSFVMKDMRTYRRAPHIMENERLYKTYPELLARIMTEIYDQDAQGKEHLLPTILKSLKTCNVSLLDLARDAVEGVRAL